MPNLTGTLKRVPKWAWLTSAGVGIGGIAAYTIRNRAGVQDPSADTTGSTDAVTGYPTSSTPSPVPGIVVPDVQIQPSGDNSGVGDLQTLYVGALTDLFSFLGDTGAIPSPMNPQTPTIITLPVITGGGVATSPVPGVHTVPPPPSHTPPPAHTPRKPCCTYNGHPLSWWQNPKHARRGRKWRWPGENSYKHGRPFKGKRACDGGGTAGKHKREC